MGMDRRRCFLLDRGRFREHPKLEDRETVPQCFRRHGYTAWTGGGRRLQSIWESRLTGFMQQLSVRLMGTRYTMRNVKTVGEIRSEKKRNRVIATGSTTASGASWF